MNSRNVQFINDRLLLERRVEYECIIYYDITMVEIQRVLTLTQNELDEINRIIQSDFAIPAKEEKQIIDDDIPF